jgi:protein-S-isoprenylcysteine O-methyltransferase Ste14
MRNLLRQLTSFLLLPGVVAGVVPVWIARRDGTAFAADTAPTTILALAAAIVIGAVGVWLFVYSLVHFITRGRGTLAPWDPPRELVVSGPYCYVRNPMISGVCFILVAEALAMRSAPLGWWAATFAAANAVYIPLIEEPGLRSRFDGAYDVYVANVRRLIPRLSPWRGAQR